MTNISHTDADKPLDSLDPERAAVTSPETAETPETTESAADSGDIERIKAEVSPAVAGLFAEFDDEFKKDLATAHERAAMEAEDLQKEATEMRETADMIEGLAYSETDAFENLDKVVGHVRAASEKYSLPLPAKLQRAVSEYQTIQEQLSKRENAIGDKNPTATGELRMKIARSDVLKGIFQAIQENSKDVLLKAAEASNEKVSAAILRTKEAKDVLAKYPELSARNEVVADDIETAKELCYRSIRGALEKNLADHFGYSGNTQEKLRKQLTKYQNRNPVSYNVQEWEVLGKHYSIGREYEEALFEALEGAKNKTQHRKYAHLIATRIIEDIEANMKEKTLSEKIDTYNELRSEPQNPLEYGEAKFLYHAIIRKFDKDEIHDNAEGFQNDSHGVLHLFADVQSVAEKDVLSYILSRNETQALQTAEGVYYRKGEMRDQDLQRYEENRKIMEEIEPYTPGVIEKGKERQYSDLRTAVEAMEKMRTKFVEQLAHLQKEDKQIIAFLDNVIEKQKQIIGQGLEPTKPEFLITLFTKLQEAIALRFQNVQDDKKPQNETSEPSEE